jgi:hypothetical protein
MEWIQFASHELYLFVSFMCGIILGYVIGKREDNL